MTLPHVKYTAPIFGVMDNAFASNADTQKYIGDCEDVELEPIVDDVLGVRTRTAIKADLGGGIAQIDPTEAVDLLGPKSAFSTLPTESLFLIGKQAPLKSTLEHPRGAIRVAALPQGWDQGLEPRQAECVRDALMYRIFGVMGPPATGKSKVGAEILKFRHQHDFKGKTFCCASTNVAVDEIFGKTVALLRGLGLETTSIFVVRVLSLHQTLAAYKRGDFLSLDRDFNIEKLRVAMAMKDQARWASYLKASQQLRHEGVISAKAVMDSWLQGTMVLTRMIMDNARIAFATTAATRSNTFYSFDPKTEKECVWPATSFVFDEIGCAHDIELLLVILTFKRTLEQGTILGDYKQLPPYCGSKQGSTYFARLFLLSSRPTRALTRVT